MASALAMGYTPHASTNMGLEYGARYSRNECRWRHRHGEMANLGQASPGVSKDQQPLPCPSASGGSQVQPPVRVLGLSNRDLACSEAAHMRRGSEHPFPPRQESSTRSGSGQDPWSLQRPLGLSA